MNNFFVGLQFLTRLHFVKQTTWSNESFGRSVKHFTLIGLILGILLAGIAYLLFFCLPQYGLSLPHHFAGLVVVFAGILLTGGLHCDGFMDTMDGIFSGRSRERMLEIMKDSHVGANGVCGFVMLALMKWSLVVGQSPRNMLIALLLMPVLGRLAMVMCVTLFPYARPEGIGKAFAEFAGKKSFYFAFTVALILVLTAMLMGYYAAPAALAAVMIFNYWFSTYIVKRLGGLTGDVYGAATELCETVVLFIFLFA